jgi:hypothetical protein
MERAWSWNLSSEFLQGGPKVIVSFLSRLIVSSARLIMRTEGSLRLILNVAIWSQIRPEKAGDKAVRFVATALEGSSLCSYLIRVRLLAVCDVNSLGRTTECRTRDNRGY